MCTLVLLRRPGHRWPLLIAGNRDEMADRPAAAPARHWPDRAEIVGGQDRLAGGSWLAVSDGGLFAALLNRMGTLGPEAGKRSRGELVLDALDHADAASAAEALVGLNPQAFRPFNLVLADADEACLLVHDGATIGVTDIPPGLHMIRHGALDDPEDEVIAAFRPRFAAAAVPDPDSGDWAAWQALLAHRNPEPALCFLRESGYGTRSSALLALADPRQRPSGAALRRLWHADGPPDSAPFAEIA